MDGQERREPHETLQDGRIVRPLELVELSTPIRFREEAGAPTARGEDIGRGAVCKPAAQSIPQTAIPDLPPAVPGLTEAGPQTAETPAEKEPPEGVPIPADVPPAEEIRAADPLPAPVPPAKEARAVGPLPTPVVPAEEAGAISPLPTPVLLAKEARAVGPLPAALPPAGETVEPLSAKAPQPLEPPPAKEPAPPAAPKPLSNEAVTGHTAALWRYRPIPEDEPEPAPEYLQKDQTYPGGRVLAARVRGKKHKHEGTNCDDWFEAAACGELVFAAVSDGAGSKRFSRIGARESCRAAVGFLRSELEALLNRKPGLLADVARDFKDPLCMPACGEFASVVQQAVRKAREAVEAAWYTRLTDPAYEAVLGRPLALTDLSATLLVAAVIPAGAYGRLVVSCQVGDGMIALVDSRGAYDQCVKLMGEADSGEFSGETDFLTSPRMGMLETLQNRTKLSRGTSDALLLMTDGVADDYFPAQTGMRRLYLDLLANGALPVRVENVTAAQMQRYSRLPAPLSYPWVNDQTVQVPLHYVRRMAEEKDMEALWTDRTALALAGLSMEGEGPAERLQRWLDNYVERGSFDDRTLLAILM